MARSKSTRFVALSKDDVAQEAINEPPPPPPQGISNQVEDALLLIDLIQPPQIVRSTSMPLIRPSIPLPVLQPASFPSF